MSLIQSIKNLFSSKKDNLYDDDGVEPSARIEGDNYEPSRLKDIAELSQEDPQFDKTVNDLESPEVDAELSNSHNSSLAQNWQRS